MRELDAAVSQWIGAVLSDPETVYEELERARERMQARDTSGEELAALDQELADIVRQQKNLVDNLAELDADSAGVVRDQLTTLSGRRKLLDETRAGIVARRDQWAAAREHLDQAGELFRTVSERLAHPTFHEQRATLNALHVQVTVWRAGHTPRFEIGVDISVSDPITDDGVLTWDGSHEAVTRSGFLVPTAFKLDRSSTAIGRS